MSSMFSAHATFFWFYHPFLNVFCHSSVPFREADYSALPSDSLVFNMLRTFYIILDLAFLFERFLQFIHINPWSRLLTVTLFFSCFQMLCTCYIFYVLFESYLFYAFFPYYVSPKFCSLFGFLYFTIFTTLHVPYICSPFIIIIIIILCFIFYCLSAHCKFIGSLSKSRWSRRRRRNKKRSSSSRRSSRRSRKVAAAAEEEQQQEQVDEAAAEEEAKEDEGEEVAKKKKKDK